MNFESHYFEEGAYNIPIHLDHVLFDENMNVVDITIPNHYIKEMIDLGYLKEAPEKKNIDPTIKWKDEAGNEKDFEVSFGNVKVGGNTVILNMSTATGCMSAQLGLCSLGANGTCYARRQEVQHPGDEGSLGKNKRHEQQWSCLTPDAIAQGIINVNEKLGGKIKFLRVNEAGEFRNLPTDPELLAKLSDEKKAQLGGVDDVGKLAMVAKKLLEKGSDIVVYTYTHRTDLKTKGLGPNIVINGSGFMNDNAFVPIEYKDFMDVWDLHKNGELKGKVFAGTEVKTGVFCMGDCRVCRWCKQANGNHIFIPIHGSKTKYNQAKDKFVERVVMGAVDLVRDETKSDDEKANILLAGLSPEDMDFFRIMIPIRNDRIEILKGVISGKKTILDFANDLGSAFNSNDYIEIGQHESDEAIAASIDALSGKIKADIEMAIQKRDAGEVKQSTVDKWNTLQKQLNTAITNIKKNSSKLPSKEISNLWKRQKAGTY